MAFVARTDVNTPYNMMTDTRGYEYYYSSNNIYNNGSAYLPNCTCYAYGRFAEIRGSFQGLSTKLPISDATNWYANATGLEKGSTPRLGAILCMSSPLGYDGHVCVVERIEGNTIYTSNSGYSRPAQFPVTPYDGTPFFWVESCTASNNYLPQWAINRGYTFAGFIYNDGGSGVSISDYVLSAICGTWWMESAQNPHIWENDNASAWSAMSIGYGLGQWTNTSGSMRLENMATWCRNNGYHVVDTSGNTAGTIDPNGQLAFLIAENAWYPYSAYRVYNFQTLQEFLSSTETNIDNLTNDFFCGWESGGTIDPSYYAIDIRKYAANWIYKYIQAHKNDTPPTQWYGSVHAFNRINPSGYPPANPTEQDFQSVLCAESYNNIMCTYFWFQGQSPTPPTPPPTPTKKGMPLWMMLRYF